MTFKVNDIVSLKYKSERIGYVLKIDNQSEYPILVVFTHFGSNDPLNNYLNEGIILPYKDFELKHL